MGIFSRRSKDLFTVSEPASFTPAPNSPFTASGGFWLVVADCFAITGRGVVVTGTVESGTVEVGSHVTLERAGQAIRSLEISGIEQARTVVSTATAGATVGLLLRGAAKGEIVRGDIIRT